MFDEQKNEANKNVVMNPSSSADDENEGLSGVIQGGKGITKPSTNQSKSVKDIKVHTMPGKFLPDSPSDKKSGPGKKIALIMVGLVLIIIVIVGGAIWFLDQQKNKQETNDNQNQVAMVNEETNENTNTNANTNVNANENANQNSNENTNTNTNTNINENTNTNANTNTNTNNNTNTNIDKPGIDPLMPEHDADQDELSYEEEVLYGTDPELADTDKDGYSDGSELFNLYDPLLPANLLIDSGLVSVFINDDYGYSILKPSSWLARSFVDRSDNINVLPYSESGEEFNITIFENTEGWSLTQAVNYVFEDGYDDRQDFNNYTLAGQPALRSKDGLVVVMIYNDNIYTISHSANVPVEQMYFNQTFDMMLNSFILIDE